MTDIVPSNGGLPAGYDAAKADKIRDTLRRIHRQYLAPFAAWDAAEAEGRHQRDVLHDRPAFLFPKLDEPSQPKTEDERQLELGRVDRAMLGQPSLMAVKMLRSVLEDIVAGKPSPAMNRVLAGLMVGAFPNVRPYSPDTYLEALIDALDQSGLSADCVAKVCNQITRTCKFPPTVAEVVAAGDETAKSLTGRLYSIDRFIAKIDHAQRLRDWIREAPLLAGDFSNRARGPEEPRFIVKRHDPTDHGPQSWV